MPDKQVTKEGPFVLRNKFHQVLLHFFGGFFASKTKAAREPANVSVHDDADIDIEGVAENDVRSLAPHSPEACQFFHRSRNFA